MASQVDNEQVRKTFHTFKDEGRLTVFIKPQGSFVIGSSVLGGYVTSADELVRIANNYAVGGDVYFNLNPVLYLPGRRKIKASAADIREVRFIVFDLDPVSASSPNHGSAHSALLRFIGRPYASATLPQSYDAFTGRGLHVWLRVINDTKLTPEEISQRTSAIYRLAEREEHISQYGFVLDPSCSDISRVVRCPGTINSKSGTTARFSDWTQGRQPLQLSRLFGRLPASCETRLQEDTRKTASQMIAAQRPKAWLARINGAAADFLLSGVWTPGRHKLAHAAAMALAEAAVPLDIAHDLMRSAGYMCSPPLDSSDTYRTTKLAYEKHIKRMEGECLKS